MIIKGDREILEKKAAWILAERIQQVGESQASVVLAVPGGRSVGAVLRYLQFEPVDWSKVHLFMVDERLVPLTDPDSNFRLVASCVEPFLRQDQLHPYVHDSQRPVMGVERYRRLLIEYGGGFDMVLLSSGEDGHVAGLFPGHETIESREDFFLLTDSAPKLPPARMTSSRKLICRSAAALLLFFGAEKGIALSRYKDEKTSANQCPAKIVRSIPDHFVFTDVMAS